MIIPCHNHTV